MLRGVRRFGTGGDHAFPGDAQSKSGTVRYVEAHHNFATKTWQPILTSPTSRSLSRLWDWGGP